jgi:hypothetical protein
MGATGGDQISHLRTTVDTLRSENALLRSRLAELEAAGSSPVAALGMEVAGLKRWVSRREREKQLDRDLMATREAHIEQVKQLERHIAALTEAATESARQLQREKETDYQLLMIHQNLLAEFGDMEPVFLELYERCKPFTMTSIERLYSLYKSVEYLSASGIPGDLVECGVWRGGSCMLMALVLLKLRDTGRRIIMFDTFEGHPRPDAERDVDLWGNRAADEWQRREASGTTAEWGFAALAETQANLRSTGYPADQLVFVKGMVEATVPQNAPECLALLRLDTDWYESTRAALQHLYPKLTPGGVLIIDDYGHYKGQRQAVDAYLREIGSTPLLHRIDYSCRVMIKATPRFGRTGHVDACGTQHPPPL